MLVADQKRRNSGVHRHDTCVFHMCSAARTSSRVNLPTMTLSDALPRDMPPFHQAMPQLHTTFTWRTASTTRAAACARFPPAPDSNSRRTPTCCRLPGRDSDAAMLAAWPRLV